VCAGAKLVEFVARRYPERCPLSDVEEILCRRPVAKTTKAALESRAYQATLRR